MLKDKNSKDDLVRRYYELNKDFGITKKSLEACKVETNLLLKSILELVIEKQKLDLREFGKFEIKKAKNGTKERITFKMSSYLRNKMFGGIKNDV